MVLSLRQRLRNNFLYKYTYLNTINQTLNYQKNLNHFGCNLFSRRAVVNLYSNVMQSQSKQNQSPDDEKKTEQTVHKQRSDAERQK